MSMKLRGIGLENIKTRSMREEDVDAVTNSDNMHFRTSKPEYYKDKPAVATNGAGQGYRRETVGTVPGSDKKTGRYTGSRKWTRNGTVNSERGRHSSWCPRKRQSVRTLENRYRTIRTLVRWSEKNMTMFLRRSGFIPSDRLSPESSLE